MKEGQKNLFCLAGTDLGLDWARLPRLNSLLVLFFGLRGVIIDHPLVHHGNVAQHGERAVVDGGSELGAYLDMLLFLLI